MKVFVTGGTGAIGQALVRAYVDAGHEVTFSYASSSEEAETLVRETSAQAVHIDLREFATMPSVIDCDILLGNAGVNLSGTSALDTSMDEIRESLEINTLGHLEMVKRSKGRMLAQSWGRIVFINSLYGLIAPKLRLSYSVSKFALRAISMTLSQELAGYGVTVNDVCPGPTDTKMLRSMAAQAVEQGRYDNVSEYLAAVALEVPNGRLTDPSEIAACCLYLTSPSADGCTGQAIQLDGGLLQI
jgi:NAD(P)-dependent dehydrogenase (short-subunit alcohol dehydrogenase family)